MIPRESDTSGNTVPTEWMMGAPFVPDHMLVTDEDRRNYDDALTRYYESRQYSVGSAQSEGRHVDAR